MALFVLGAGCTRGSSFVAEKKSPCLPPLDGDFFTQLQRVRNPKHQAGIDAVMHDVVDLFGHNFNVTMETVFSTLEHTIRMLELTGETRDFKKSDLKARRDRLVQAIAGVFEESLTEPMPDGRSTVTPWECAFHKQLVQNQIAPQDDIVTFNYDCVLDYALKTHGANKWDPRYGYGFHLGSKGSLLKGDKYWSPLVPATKEQTVHLFKLHGSLHFDIQTPTNERSPVRLKKHPYTKKKGEMHFTIIPPEWHKNYREGTFAVLWRKAAEAIHQAKHLVVIGYSLPPTDLHASALFHTSIKKRSLRSLVVVNPDRSARHRVRAAAQRGFTNRTRVLSFDRLEDFLDIDRGAWAV